jgi:hypothetical protein
MRALTVVGTLLLSSPHTAEAQRLVVAHWGMFEERRLGTRVEYPVDVFSISEGASERGIGEHFRTADGRAQLIIYSLPAEAGDTPASFLRKNLVVQLSASDYRRVTASFFAISAHRNGVIYYSRCNFSSNGGGAAHCFDLRYPEREKLAWDDVVTRISRSLRPLVRNMPAATGKLVNPRERLRERRTIDHSSSSMPWRVDRARGKADQDPAANPDQTAPGLPAQLNDTAEPTEKAKASIAAMMVNPASAEFYKLKRAVKNLLDESVDTVCGYVKGKNASGGDTGEMPFLYIIRDDRDGEAYLVDGKSYVAQTVHSVLCK